MLWKLIQALLALFKRAPTQTPDSNQIGRVDREPASPSADARFARCIPLILAHEGGYVDDPRDPGGATNLGITRATLAAWRGAPVSKDDVRALTRAEAEAIYRAKFWAAVKADDLPAGVDYAVFDYAINSGPGRAAKALQRAVGQPQDGILGPLTLAAVKAADPVQVINAICAGRLAYLQSLPGWITYGNGWGRRVAEVKAAALRMAG
jgi:lysozyme family protein